MTGEVDRGAAQAFFCGIEVTLDVDEDLGPPEYTEQALRNTCRTVGILGGEGAGERALIPTRKTDEAAGVLLDVGPVDHALTLRRMELSLGDEPA